MKCPKCGARNRDDEVLCVECGADMTSFVRKSAPKVRCPKCGESNEPDETSCRKCYSRLEPSFVLCPECARENLRSSSWCVFCDSQLPPMKPVPAPEAIKTPEAMEQTVNCPKCGYAMEPGYLLVKTGGYAVRWSTEPDNFWGTRGVPIVEGDVWLGKLSMEGFRCRGCRVVTVRY